MPYDVFEQAFHFYSCPMSLFHEPWIMSLLTQPTRIELVPPAEPKHGRFSAKI